MTRTPRCQRSTPRACWRAPHCTAPHTRQPCAEVDSCARGPRIAALFLAFELEGDLRLGAVGLHFAVLHLHVQLRDLDDAQISQGLGSLRNRCARGLLPGLGAGPDQFDDLVDAIGHGFLTFRPRSRGPPVCCSRAPMMLPALGNCNAPRALAREWHEPDQPVRERIAASWPRSC